MRRGATNVILNNDAESGITSRLEFPNSGGEDHSVDRYRLSMVWGLYTPGKGMNPGRISTDDVPGSGYNWYRLGSFPITASSYVYFFWSWYIQVDVGRAYSSETPDQKFEIWASIKFEGPEFPHDWTEANNAISVERVVLVKR